MEYRLAVFQAVADQLSFTKAARALHISQPAVTQHIRLLEEELGQPLFHRAANGILLTEAGVVLLKHAREVARLDEAVRQRIRAKRGQIRGRLILGATSTIDQYLLPEWLVSSRRAWPELELQVQSGNTDEIVAAAAARRLDLGLIEGRCTRAELRTEPFLEDELVCVASTRHPATRGKPLGLPELRRQDWIFREKGSGTRDTVERALKSHGIATRQLRIELELGSSEAIKAVVAAGLGLTFLSRTAVTRELAQGVLRTVPVRGLAITRMFSFVFPRGPKPEGAAGAFADLVRREVARQAGKAIAFGYEI